MGKGRYLLKRLIYIVFVFFIISILMFSGSINPCLAILWILCWAAAKHHEA